MKQRNKTGFIPLLLLTALSAALLNACATKAQSEDRTQPVATSASSAASASDAIDEASVVKITLRGDHAKIEGRGAAVEKGVLVIHEGGSYRLEGESRIPIEVRLQRFRKHTGFLQVRLLRWRKSFNIWTAEKYRENS